ncbi:MAG: hypothetical protein HFH72_08870 [Lachnospiraceae bacterium]|nr:hypothetical protein [Lachnospiraceae bacterium]
METIKSIMAELGEECEVDIELLHNTLLKLPAEMYLELYKKMYAKIYGYPPLFGIGGCCGTIGDNQEDNAKYYGEKPKVTKSYAVGETE